MALEVKNRTVLDRVTAWSIAWSRYERLRPGLYGLGTDRGRWRLRAYLNAYRFLQRRAANACAPGF